MLIFIVALLVGFVLLMWSAEKFVSHALHLDQHFNISKLVIGMVVLGFGTSSPELLVSGLSALQGNPGLAIGNALGSNTTNILLILGVTLCIIPLYIDKRIVGRDFILLIGSTALFTILILNKQLNQLDGVLLIIALLLVLYLLAKFELREHIREETHLTATDKSLADVMIGIALGLVILLISSKLVVWSAISIAEQIGISDLIIGLTIVALGTSLPELATCISSALKKHSELALGNIIGSNIFNTLGVTGIACLISDYSIPRVFYIRDFPIMIGASAVLFFLALLFLRTKNIPRGFGIIFITAYLFYMFFIYRQAL